MTRKINELTIPTDGLVLDLPLDGNANARVGSDGTATNMTWTTAERGYVSEVGSFNGSNSSITTSGLTGALFDGDFDISFSFKYELYGDEDYFFSGQLKDLAVKFNPNGLAFTMYDGTEHLCEYNISNFTIGENYQVLASRSKTEGMKLYVNGVLVDSDSFVGNANSSTGNPTIGYRYPGSYVQAKIGLFKIYNKTLSQDEIDALYSEGLRKLGPFAEIGSSEYTNIRTGLVGEWGLNDNALDSSGNDNHGTPSNLEYSPVWGGKVGSFNGSSSYIINPSTSGTILDNDFSISLSFKVDSSASSQGFLYSFGERDLGIRWGNVTDNIQFQLYDGTINAYLNCPVEKNKYYEAVFVRDKINGMSIYLNGVLCASNSYTGNALSGGGRNEQVGRVATTQYFNGQIGLVKIYNRALSEQEIKTQYSEGLRYIYPQVYTPASLPTPVLDISRPANGGVYYDQSGNGNNGTPTNVTDSVKGKYNVMSFNGSSSLLNTNYDLDETSDFSISIYGKINTRTFGHFFSTFNDNANNEWWVGSWNVVDGNEGKLFFSGKPYNTYYSNSRVDDNKYHHIVMTRNSSNDELKLYIDGILEINVTESFLQELDAIRCGSNNFNGELLLVKIYDTVLTDKQVEQDYYSSFIPN